jgi:hypothetical protein
VIVLEAALYNKRSRIMGYKATFRRVISNYCIIESRLVGEVVLFREEVLKGVFFLVEFEDFLSYDCFRYSVAIGYFEYRNYFGYIFERKTSYIYNPECYLVYSFTS